MLMDERSARNAAGPGIADLETVRHALELRSGELVALSVLYDRGADAASFQLPDELGQATAWVQRHAGPSCTISVGVATLSSAGAERLAEANAARRRARPRADEHAGYSWVAADLDPKAGEDLADLRARIEAFPLRPTLLVASGRGMHAWYRLAAPVSVEVGKATAADLARALDGDTGAATVDRALRLPGTWNPKPDARRLALVLEESDSRYTAEQLSDAAQAIRPAEPAPVSSPRQNWTPPRSGSTTAERLRNEHDLADTLERLSGSRSRGGVWRCPGGHDNTPSLHLLQNEPQRWICEGSGHPESLGKLTTSGRFSGDVTDLLAWEAGQTPARYLSAEHARTVPIRATTTEPPTDPTPAKPERQSAKAGAPDRPAQATSRHGSGGREASAADRLVQLALDRFTLGRSDSDGPYAVPKTGPRLVRLLRGSSQSLRAELAQLFYALEGKAPNAGALADALMVLEGMAGQQSAAALALRIAQYEAPNGTAHIVLDLGDATGRAVVIDADGWRVVDRPPVLFRRTALTSPLPVPQRGGQLEEFRDLLNVTDESWQLLRGALVAAYIPDVPHPIVLLTGEHGTGKTSAAKRLVQLLDPSAAPVRAQPHKEDDWGVTANGSYVIGIDNVSTIAPWLSDAWCRAVTGDGYVRRQLYTDSDLTVIALRRQIVLTGIDPAGVRGDLADRLLRVELATISAEQRLTDRDLDKRWADAHPRILGALLELLVKTLRALPTARDTLTERPRLADFAEVLHAVDMVTGSTALDLFKGLGLALARDVIEGDSVGSALLRLLDRQQVGFTGEMADLFEALHSHAPRPLPATWPGSTAALGLALKRLAPSLRASGISYRSYRSNGRRLVDLTKGATA